MITCWVGRVNNSNHLHLSYIHAPPPPHYLHYYPYRYMWAAGDVGHVSSNFRNNTVFLNHMMIIINYNVMNCNVTNYNVTYINLLRPKNTNLSHHDHQTRYSSCWYYHITTIRRDILVADIITSRPSDEIF